MTKTPSKSATARDLRAQGLSISAIALRTGMRTNEVTRACNRGAPGWRPPQRPAIKSRYSRRQFTFRLTDEVIAHLRATAKERGCTCATVARELFEQWLSAEKKGRAA